MIRPVQTSDAETICRIYNEYIENSTVTFEEETTTVSEITIRIKKVTKNYPWLVYEHLGDVIGYTYASKWKDRSAYRFAVETAIYLDSKHHGKGVGTQLKGSMIEELRKRSFHSVISGIALPNPASIALCKKFGFKKIAHFKEVGFKMDKWIDVGYWQLML